MTTDRAFAYWTFGAAAILIALVLAMSDLGRPQLWPLAGCFALWSASPAMAPYFLAQHSDSDRFAALMFAVSMGASAIAVAGYGYAILAAKGPTAGLIFVFMPFFLWAALLAILAVCAAVSRLGSPRVH